MTLKNSFSNVLKEDRKRRIWTLVVFGLLCFLMTAVFELNLESYINREWTFQKIQGSIESLTRDGMISTYLVFAGIAACLYGFQGFAWLTRKRQVDFYHSQPMKREKRFLVIYLNGIIMCLLPMFLHLAVYTALIGFRGYLNVTIISHLLMNMGIFLLAFFMMYHLVILSLMLCGNIIVSFMIGVTLFVYPSIVKYLVESFLNAYFDTYAAGYSNTTGWMGYFSPVEQLYRAGNYFITGRMSGLGTAMIILAVMAVLFGGLSFYLYKKRPSEAAGNALAYPLAGDFIRFLIVIPAGMFFGIVFASFGAVSGVFWLFFGTIVGVVLAHGFMEVIFQFDIKAALGKKGQLGAALILVMCIVNIFCFDIFGYDTYVPEEDQVEEASYYINIGEHSSNYYALNEEGIPIGTLNNGIIRETAANVTSSSVSSLTGRVSMPYSSDLYVSRETHQMEASKTKEIGPILDLVHGYMKQTDEAEGMRYSMVVHYKMKNGRDVYRNYRINRDVLEKYYEPIYETEQGKATIYPYLSLTGKNTKEVSIYTPFMYSKTLDLTKDEIIALIDCYKKDLKDMELKELMEARYLGELNLVYDRQAGTNKDELRLSLYIGDGYENMIEFFEEKGIHMTLPNDNFTIVDAIVFNPYGIDESMEHPFWKGRQEVPLTQDEIDELLPYMIPDEYGYGGADYEFFLSGYMTVRNNETGTLKQVYCNLSSAKTPDYMRITE